MFEMNQNVKSSLQQYYQHISGQNLTSLCCRRQTPTAHRPTGIIREFVRY